MTEIEVCGDDSDPVKGRISSNWGCVSYYTVGPWCMVEINRAMNGDWKCGGGACNADCQECDSEGGAGEVGGNWTQMSIKQTMCNGSQCYEQGTNIGSCWGMHGVGDENCGYIWGNTQGCNWSNCNGDCTAMRCWGGNWCTKPPWVCPCCGRCTAYQAPQYQPYYGSPGMSNVNVGPMEVQGSCRRSAMMTHGPGTCYYQYMS